MIHGFSRWDWLYAICKGVTLTGLAWLSLFAFFAWGYPS